MTRTKQTEDLLQLLDETIRIWKRLDFNKAFSAPALEQVVSNVERARRQFDSKLFFVVIFGPLKAGKSTLTNALAGGYVSPTGFGKETTRRPSLVIRAEESGVEQYFSTDQEVNHFLNQLRLQKNGEGIGGAIEGNEQILRKVREAFDAIADFLRGIVSEDEIQERIRWDSFPLNPENLEKALTQDLTSEPLLTVIKCKGGHLLSDGVAVVDMPGLDGSRSNWRDDPIHEWVISRAEFFLFVQSSVAALNNQTHDFLKEIVAQSTKPPIWLVQNVFEAQHWQPKEKQRKDADNQRVEGTERIVQLLNEAPRAVSGLNAGLAWDAKAEDRNEWLEQSEFSKFETDLTEVLRNERASIQERNCLEYLKQKLDEAKGELKHTAQKVEGIRRDYMRIRGRLGAALERLEAVNYRSKWENAVCGEIGMLVEPPAQHWHKDVDNKIDRLKTQHNRERTGKEVNDAVRNAAVEMALAGQIRHFAKSSLLPEYKELADKFCEPAETKALSSCNEILKELELEEIPPPVLPSAGDLPEMATDVFNCQTLPEKKNWFGIGGKTPIDKKYNGTVIASHLTTQGIDWKAQIDEKKENWQNQLQSDHFSTYCEKRRRHFCAHIERLLADFEAIAKTEESAANSTENLLRQMNENLSELKRPLANANASMK